MAWSTGAEPPGMFRAVSCCSWDPTNKTILIVSFVTPIVVAPPLFSPSFMGRVHGARC